MTRNRVGVGEAFYYLTTNPTGTRVRVERAFDYHHDHESKLYDLGNYFATSEEAMEYANKIRSLLQGCEKIS